MICHHQLPRIACVYCLHADVEQLKAERQQLRIAIYRALEALEADDLESAANALCAVTEGGG